MLDFFGTIALTVAMTVTVNALLASLPVSRRARLGLALLVGAWIGLSVALASTGAYADAGRRTFPLIGAMAGAPLLAAATLVLLSPAVRAALLALPTALLIGLNALRVFGGFFLLLAAADRLGGPFPQSAGWGDVVTGALALPVAWLATRAATERRQWLVYAWNSFGTLDLVVAVTLGVLSGNGSPLQLIHAGAGSTAIQQLPWALIPTVLVPTYLVMHGVVFAQLRRRGAAARDVPAAARGALSYAP